MAKDKVKAKKGDKEKKAKKADKLSPLEKARLAKKAGKSAPAKKKKAGLPIFKAPADFKPFFARVQVRIGKDGLFSDMKCERIKGSPNNENAKTVDMAAHDPDTLRKMAARYGGAAFVTNAAKRLPANSTISFLMRVSMKKDTGALATSFKEFTIKEKDAKKAKELEKSDPIYRRARKPVRFMPAAFTTVKEFPSAAELKMLRKNDEEPEVESKSKKAKKADKKKSKK